MGQALYRKYRSTSLSEIVGQEHITTALQHAIDSGRISHAYLLTGPRGTGKTSIARILAHAVNGLPYSSDPHLDIIEIDAASNRRIDEIRELRDKVYIAPSSVKYKVYIIDEVHMLTREAFNALLKTLEEPPEHAIFILATTDAHKVPDTIVSRTQRYSFRPVAQAQVIEHLQHIAQAEQIKIDPGALALLAQHGEGSFRDSISMLDQVGNSGETVTVELVRLLLGVPPDDAIEAVIDTLAGSDIAAPVIALQALYDHGYRAPAIASRVAELLRSRLAGSDASIPAATALTVLAQLLDVAASHNPERLLEIILMQAITPPAVQPTTVAAVPKTTTVSKPAIPKSPTPVTKVEPQPPEEPAVESVVPVQPASTPTHQIIDETSWPDILAELKKQYNTLYGIIRMAQVDFSEPGVITLSFKFAFHQKRISDAKNRKLITDIVALVTGQPVELKCIVSKDAKPTPSGSLPGSDNSIRDISAVFGGGELL